MTSAASLFLDFNLPNATTWFYFSFLLAVALFFKFTRLFSVRNWDVITLFLLVPGLLVVEGARLHPVRPAESSAVRIASVVARCAAPGDGCSAAAQVVAFAPAFSSALEARTWLRYGYLWLMCGSAYFFFRCLFDLALVQRPALAPNLNFGGLAWLAGALMVCLVAVAFRQAERQWFLPNRPPEGLPPAAEPGSAQSAPVALARTWFDPPWIASLIAVLCHLAVVTGLVFIGWRHFQDPRSGMAAATFYLMLPYTGLYVGQVQHVAPMALLIWVVAAYRRPMLSGTLLGLASAVAYFPLLMVPVWVSFYRGRGVGRFLSAFALALALALSGLGLTLWAQGDLDGVLRAAAAQNAWQPWKVPTTEGFWTGVHWAYRIPVFLAYLAFVLATLFWPIPKNLAHLVALSAAVPIGLQFWYADRGGIYVLWYLPLLLLLIFRPNLKERLASPIDPQADWLRRLQRALTRLVRWAVRIPEASTTIGS